MPTDEVACSSCTQQTKHTTKPLTQGERTATCKPLTTATLGAQDKSPARFWGGLGRTPDKSINKGSAMKRTLGAVRATPHQNRAIKGICPERRVALGFLPTFSPYEKVGPVPRGGMPQGNLSNHPNEQLATSSPPTAELLLKEKPTSNALFLNNKSTAERKANHRIGFSLRRSCRLAD